MTVWIIWNTFSATHEIDITKEKGSTIVSENPTPGEIDLLEKLALGLLVYPGDPRASKPRLFLGKIPENLPIEIPIPEQSHVVGTLARSETQIEIVLESDLTPEEVFSFYRAQLTSLGWREPEGMWPQHGGGFLHSDFGPHMTSTFCQEPGGAGGPLAWHTWHFTSEDQEPWSGLFFILKTPEKPDDYFLYVRAAWTKPEGDQKFTGWLSSSSTFSTSSTVIRNPRTP